jgi:hypothetical protein
MGSGLAIFLSTFFKALVLYFIEKWRKRRRARIAIVTAPALPPEAVPLLEDLRSDRFR